MSCNDFARELEARRDQGGELPAGPLEHARACPRCAQVLQDELRLRRGLQALRGAQEGMSVPAGLAARARRAAASRPAPPARVTWPMATAVAVAAGLLAAAVLVVSPPASHGLRTTGPAPASITGATAGVAEPDALAGRSATLPVVYSDGAVDIVGEAPAAPGDDARVARLVEWNL